MDYAEWCRHFGHPVALVQVIKHQAVECLLDVELANSAAYYAAQVAADDSDELPSVASLAKAGAADAYIQTAIRTIQMHGGIGFTWENDTHLWFKRAKISEVFLGTSVYHRELMMQRWVA